jgi:hypothetical protein
MLNSSFEVISVSRSSSRWTTFFDHLFDERASLSRVSASRQTSGLTCPGSQPRTCSQQSSASPAILSTRMSPVIATLA